MGDYNVICDRSGFKVKRSECVIEWTGSLVYEPFAEKRHPMDHFKPPTEQKQFFTTRPEKDDVEVDSTLAPNWDDL